MEVLLTRKQILEADDTQFEVIDVPKWGGKIRVRSLSGHDRARFEMAIKPVVAEKTSGPTPTWRELLVSCAVVDADGKLLFEPADIALLGKRDAGTLDKVVEAVMRISGISAKDAKEYEKNSGTTPSGDGS